MRKGTRYGLLAGLALLLAACGGGAPPPDLTLAGVSPDNPSVVQGGSVTLTLTLTSQNGFQGQVSLSVTENGQAPPWLTLSPTSKSLNVPKGGQVQESLQVQVAGNAPIGPHALKLKVGYGGKTAERDLTLTVNAPAPAPSFALALSPTSLTVQQGSSNTTTLTVTPQNGFTGTVSLSLVGAPSGVSLSPASVSVLDSAPVNQPLTVSVASSVAPGTYALQVKGTAGSLTQQASLSLTVTPPPSFTLSLDPASLEVQQGSSGTTTLTVTPQNGFTGTVSLSLVAGQDQVPQGLTLSPPSVQVSGANPVTQTLTFSALSSTPTGTYRLKVRGTAQNLTREADLTVTVSPPPSFALSDPNPNPLTVPQGGTATFQVTLTSQNGFQGQVMLSLADGQDPLPQGLSLTATNPSPISLQAGGSVTVTATVRAEQGVAPNTYRLKVRAQGGSLVQEKPLTVQVVLPPSFDFSLRNSPVTTARDPSLRLYNWVFLTFTTQNGFQGQVNLSIVDDQGNPVPGLSLDPASVNVTGNQDFYVYVVADNTIPLFGAGKGYAVRLRASSGSIVREQPLTVDVWTHIGVANLNWQWVAYGNGIFVVAGENGYDGYSRIYVYNPQNRNFTKVYEASSVGGPLCGGLRGVTYDPVHQTWVAVGSSGTILVSADNAQTWQIVSGARPSSCNDAGRFEKVRYLNDRLWAMPPGHILNNTIWFSQNGGYTWNPVSIPVPSGYTEANLRGLTYGRDKYVGVGVLKTTSDSDRPALFIYDGSTWTISELNTPPDPWGQPLWPNEVLYVPDWGKFVMVGESGLLGTSSDGVNWSFQVFSDVGHLTDLTYGNGVVLAGSWGFAKVLVSSDGQNWRLVGTHCQDATAMSVAFGSGIFIHTSANGVCGSP